MNEYPCITMFILGYNSSLLFIKDDGTTMADYTILHNTDDDIDSSVLVNITFIFYFFTFFEVGSLL